MASRWQHCADLTGRGIEPPTSLTDSERLATELTPDLTCTCSDIKNASACRPYGINHEGCLLASLAAKVNTEIKKWL